jgi:hypothetical protein
MVHQIAIENLRTLPPFLEPFIHSPAHQTLDSPPHLLEGQLLKKDLNLNLVARNTLLLPDERFLNHQCLKEFRFHSCHITAAPQV